MLGEAICDPAALVLLELPGNEVFAIWGFADSTGIMLLSINLKF
jgi:hypothetical protein